MNRLPTEPNSEPTPLFNPELADFTFEYDRQGEKRLYIVPGLAIATAPRYIADLMASQMADLYVQTHKSGLDYDSAKKDILSRIYVSL